MKVQKGYKQTEIGIIPEEWEVKELGNLSNIIASGKSNTEHNEDGIYPIFGSTGIIGYKNYFDYEGKKITIARVGANAGRVNFIDGKYCISDNTIFVEVNESSEIEFIDKYLRSINLNKYIFGSGQPLITGTILKNIQIPFPSFPEQSSIATVLSDIDEYILSLERLITKKKAIKQGAMQNLLTGKIRLKGFEGEWVEKRIENYGCFVSGNGFPLMHQGRQSGKYPFYKVSDFSNAGNEFVFNKANNYISQAMANKLNCNIIPQGAIIFAKIGAAIFLERKRQNYCDCCIDNNMMAFVGYANRCDSKYLMYLFHTFKFGDLVTATALPSLSGTQVGRISRLFPPTLAEQTAIATILSDMDTEIEALQAKLNKAKQVKQGAMQQLLTGKIRLVVSG